MYNLFLVEIVVDSVLLTADPYWKPRPGTEVTIGQKVYKCCVICHSYYKEVKEYNCVKQYIFLYYNILVSRMMYTSIYIYTQNLIL